MEKWKKIKNFEDFYQISNKGNIKSIFKTKDNVKELYLSLSKDKRGYFQIHLRRGIYKRGTKVHILVAEHFIPNFKNKPQVNHIDGNKENNYIENLEWCTNHENNKHANELGLYDKVSKKVIQFDNKDNLIKIWKSTMEIQRTLKIWNSQISRCCLNEYGKYRAGGFKWKYE